MMPHYLSDSIISLDFPKRLEDIYYPKPSITVVVDDRQVIAVMHIIYSGYLPFGFISGSKTFCLKSTRLRHIPYGYGVLVDNCPKLKLLLSPFTSPIEGAKLCISASIRPKIGSLDTQFFRPLLPALPLMTKHPCWNNMLPFNTLSSVLLFTHLVATRG